MASANYFIKKKKGQLAMITYILKRVSKKISKNFLALITGAPGDGKTYHAIAKALLLDPTFTADQIVFCFKDLMKLIKQDWFLQKKIRVVIFDEPQTDISNKSWASLTNRLFNYLISTFRSRNIIVLFCTPFRDFLDSTSAKMIHCEFEMDGIDYKKKKSYSRPKFLQYNGNVRKYYYHHLKVGLGGGKVEDLKRMGLKIAPPEIIAEYEIAKKNFQDKLDASISRQLETLEASDEPQDKRKKLTDLQHEILERHYEGDTAEDLSKEFNCTIQNVYKHIQRAEAKGWKKEDFLNQKQTD